MGVNTYSKNGIEIYLAQSDDEVGKGWIGVFNRNASETFEGTLTKTDLGLVLQTNGYKTIEIPDSINAFDIWNNRQLPMTNKGMSVKIPADDVLYFMYSFDIN